MPLFLESRVARSRVRILAGGASLAASVSSACGPSLEMMHESNLRFEHCYRLDLDPKIAPPHREACWRDWTEVYAYGQALDRVEYARRRIVDLEQGEVQVMSIHEGRRNERVFAEVGAAESVSPMAAPAPTSAHAPPPKTEPVDSKPAPAAAAEPPAGDLRPGDACAADCSKALDTCTGLCRAKQADCVVCRDDFRRCMRRCFE